MRFLDRLSQRASNAAAAPFIRERPAVLKGFAVPGHNVPEKKIAHTRTPDIESAHLQARRRAQRCHCSSSEKSMEETEYPIHTDITIPEQGVTDAVAERSGALPMTAKELLKDTLDILYRNFWPLVLLFALSDALMFGLHRISHRITNEAAIRFLGKAITPESIGNLNFLAANPEIANFETGYQYLVIIFFLVVFPLNIFIRSFASTITILYAWRKAGDPESCPDCRPTWVPPVRVMWRNLSAIWPRVWGSLLRVWMVDLLVSVRVLPLQAMSLLVITLPWTLPRLLSLQLATAASVVEGVEGEEAVERSRELTKLQGVKKALLWPYLGLIVAARLVSMGRAPLLSALPGRIIREVPEVPFAIYCAMLLTSVVVSRLQDVLPLAVYMKAKSREYRFSE